MAKSFQDLQLIEPLLLALKKTGYTTPTPIQEQAIPHLLAGRDLLGCAQTGTGKTAAFSLPILQNLAASKKKSKPYTPRVLILSPTRELALQIHENITTYAVNLHLRSTAIFGGVGQGPQVKQLASGVDILVATPGRLMDLLQQRYVHLKDVEIFVLDEADRMLDMGFIQPIRKIIGLLPYERQNLFFSATMPKDIQELSNSILVHPVKVEVTPVSSTTELVKQKLFYVEKSNKKDLLRTLLLEPALKRVIVFTRTKHGANRVSEILEKNRIPSSAIHGNKSQGARQRALSQFQDGEIRVLVATDIAARGIDVDGITHVINYEIPNVAESYVHRIGRTGRAGSSGIALSFCDQEEKAFIKDIEKLILLKIPVETDHPYHSTSIEASFPMSKGKAKAAIEGNGGGGRRTQQNQRPKKKFWQRDPAHRRKPAKSTDSQQR
jgi:ATP-dependent RNA helicase RhlE